MKCRWRGCWWQDPGGPSRSRSRSRCPISPRLLASPACRSCRSWQEPAKTLLFFCPCGNRRQALSTHRSPDLVGSPDREGWGASPDRKGWGGGQWVWGIGGGSLGACIFLFRRKKWRAKFLVITPCGSQPDPSPQWTKVGSFVEHPNCSRTRTLLVFFSVVCEFLSKF